MSLEFGSVEIGRYIIRTNPFLPSDLHNDYYDKSIGLHYLSLGLSDVERIRESWAAGESVPNDNFPEFYHALTLGIEGGLEMLMEEDVAVHPEILERARKVLEENREVAEELFMEIMEKEFGDLYRQVANLLGDELEEVPSP